MDVRYALLIGIALPAAVTAAVLIPLVLIRARGAADSDRPWALALAMGAGYVAGHVGVAGRWPGLPPNDVVDWLVYAAVVSAILGLVESLPLPVWPRWGLRAAVITALVCLTLRPMVEYTWSRGEAAAWLVGLSVAVVAFWAVLEASSSRQQGVWTLLAVLAVAAGTGGALMLSGSALLAQLSGVVMAVIAVAGATEVGLARRAGGRPVALAALILSGLWMNGIFYAWLPRTSAALLAAAPLAALATAWGPLRRRHPAVRALAFSLVVGAMILIAVLLAIPPESEEYGTDEYW